MCAFAHTPLGWSCLYPSGVANAYRESAHAPILAAFGCLGQGAVDQLVDPISRQ